MIKILQVEMHNAVQQKKKIPQECIKRIIMNYSGLII